MHVGMATIFQNPQRTASDYQVYRDELRLAEMVETLGFQSIWGVEHHFTDYTMCPDVIQFLSYMAGRTKDVQLGSMVVVLPWHDPVRVAEEVAMLDNLSDGRVIFGIGRGLGRVEYEGFRQDMSQSRTRFIESNTKPKLFIQGELDRFGNAEAIERLLDRVPEPKELVVIPGSDHFFTGEIEAVETAVADWAPRAIAS